jgi:hypothetical protein
MLIFITTLRKKAGECFLHSIQEYELVTSTSGAFSGVEVDSWSNLKDWQKARGSLTFRAEAVRPSSHSHYHRGRTKFHIRYSFIVLDRDSDRAGHAALFADRRRVVKKNPVRSIRTKLVGEEGELGENALVNASFARSAI